MLPILYSVITEGTVPSNYGASGYDDGVLSDCLSCEIKEARNGEYELEMEYAAEGIHAASIVPNAVIKAKPNYTDDPQLFRIYQVGKTINGKFSVKAQHITYDLSGKVIISGSASSCGSACALLTAQSGNFTISTDIGTSADFNIDVPSSVRSWFGGKQGSLLDIYGGEWHYNNFSATLMGARGMDRGVTIRYGKNLTELSQVLDMTNLVSAVIPYYKAQDGAVTSGSEVPTGLTGINRKVAIDFSSGVDPDSATPITTQLATLATNYIANNNLTELKNNIKLDFVQLQGLTERVDLCDTVHIFYEPLGLTAVAKCIETVWDVINERYTSTTFGDPKTNITDTIVATQKEIAAIPNEIDHATSLITGNLGGYVVLHDSNGDGKPDEILIMDSPDIATAVKVWRWNQMGLGYSGTGYAGPFNKLALTNDGMIVADQIKTGVISDVQGNSTIDMTNGEAKMKDFKAVNSLQLIDENDVTKASIAYSDNTGESLIRTFNQSGNVRALIGTTSRATGEGQLELYGSNDALQALVSGGLNGGLLSLIDVNGKDTVMLYNEQNGGGRVHVFDKGSNESEFVVWDSDGNPCATMKMDNGNGTFESYRNGSVMSVMRCNANGGVVDVYDQQYLQIQLVGNGGVVTCVRVNQTSSRKVKENIKPMESEEARKILDLEAVSFDYKNKSSGTNKRGFIAEDVAEVLPNLVTAETEELPASLDYIGMIPYLQAVIKEQEKRIEALEKKVNGK